MKPFKLPARLWQTLLLVLTAVAFSPCLFSQQKQGKKLTLRPFMQPHGALLPPIIAIGLALITKEVYSSLFLGIVMGGFVILGFPLKERPCMFSKTDLSVCCPTAITSAS